MKVLKKTIGYFVLFFVLISCEKSIEGEILISRYPYGKWDCSPLIVYKPSEVQYYPCSAGGAVQRKKYVQDSTRLDTLARYQGKFDFLVNMRHSDFQKLDELENCNAVTKTGFMVMVYEQSDTTRYDFGQAFSCENASSNFYMKQLNGLFDFLESDDASFQK